MEGLSKCHGLIAVFLNAILQLLQTGDDFRISHKIRTPVAIPNELKIIILFNILTPPRHLRYMYILMLDRGYGAGSGAHDQ